VLGIGSTGLEVAEQLAEHLTWQFGDFERAAWVRILVSETAQKDSPLGDRVIWAGMSPGEYTPYVHAPNAAGAEFGFGEWHHRETLSKIDTPSAGAANCRMLGRLCFFHQRTYQKVQKRVMEEHSYLRDLTAKDINKQLRHPDVEAVLLDGTADKVVVYVVGTLCGGTCSGIAPDLGYLIRQWAGDSVTPQAFFTIPHHTLTGSTAAKLKKNAYYALKELNHYQLHETEWQQKLPSYSEPSTDDRRPYEILRIMMPNSGSGQDVRRLNAMIGQYLAAAVGPAGWVIDEADVNAKAKMESQEAIGFMRPLFSTMGLAALEFPGEHIQRAATHRLLWRTFSRWCKGSSQTDLFKHMGPNLPTSLNDFVAQLTKGSMSLIHAVMDTCSPQSSKRLPKPDEVRQQLRQLDRRLAAYDPEPGSLLALMNRNFETLLQEIPKAVNSLVQRQLLSLSGGPRLLAQVLSQYVDEIKNWSTQASDSLAEQQVAASVLEETMNGTIEKAEKAGNKLFCKRRRLRKAWQGFDEQLNDYVSRGALRLRARNMLSSQEYLKRYEEQVLMHTKRLIVRLEAMATAFASEGRRCEEQYKEMAKMSPTVNGRVFFDPANEVDDGTVGEEYVRLLRLHKWDDEPSSGWSDDQREQAAMRDVLTALRELNEEAAHPDRPSSFDGSGSVSAGLFDKAEQKARQYFLHLRRDVHIASKAEEADIHDTIMLSEPRLGIAAAQISYQLHGVRGSDPENLCYAFTKLDDSAVQEQQAAGDMARKVKTILPLSRHEVSDSDDPSRLLVLREKHGFTFGQMQGVVKAHQHDLNALEAAEHCQDFSFWHTRIDVDWTDPLVPELRKEVTEELWLIALLLGQKNDGTLPALYDKNGEGITDVWYEVVEGMFLVKHAPGAMVTQPEESLPQSFEEAVRKLVLPTRKALNDSLQARWETLRRRVGAPDVLVEALETRVSSLGALGVSDITPERAASVLRRRYSRNPALAKAYFDYSTRTLPHYEVFPGLWRSQGDPIPGRNEGTCPTDAYYCPACHHQLGTEPEHLLQQMFLCPACATGERYWP
jgi:hypothetical protein